MANHWILGGCYTWGLISPPAEVSTVIVIKTEISISSIWTNVRESRSESKMDNPETLATLSTQEKRRRQTKHKAEHRKN